MIRHTFRNRNSLRSFHRGSLHTCKDIYFWSVAKTVYGFSFSRDVTREERKRKSIIASTRYSSRVERYFSASNFPFSKFVPPDPRKLSPPLPRLITSSNVRGWSRNFAGNVADGVQRGEVAKRQGERRGREAESTPCGATFSTRNERPDAKRPPNSLPFPLPATFFPFFFTNDQLRVIIFPAKRGISRRRLKTFSIVRPIRVEGWNIYPRNFNLIGEGKKRFWFVERGGEEIDVFRFVTLSRLNFDGRATNESPLQHSRLIERVIRRFDVYKYLSPLPRSGWGKEREKLFRDGLTVGNFSSPQPNAWGEGKYATIQRRILETWTDSVVLNCYWSRRTWSR